MVYGSRFSIGSSLQRVFELAVAYLAGCGAASFSVGTAIAVKGLFMEGSGGIGVGEALLMIFGLGIGMVFPVMLVFALPGFVVFTTCSKILRLRNAFGLVLGWSLNGIVSSAVLAGMGGHLTGSGSPQSMIILFGIAGGLGGAVAWMTDQSLQNKQKNDGALSQ